MQITNLVFEGGGVKGIAYGGALTRLEELGHLGDIKRVAGTSAGAITATLMAVGYDSQEISDIISQTNFNDFADDDPGFFKDIYRLITNYGWHKGDKFKDWISDLIEQKLGKSDLRFSELNSLANVDGKLKDLYVVGSNLSTQKPEVFSHETTPGMKIKEAVRISMSIPFYFQAVINPMKEVLVDGAVIRNYPINLFDHPRYLSNDEAIQSQDYIFNHETLGFRLDDKDDLEKAVSSQEITDIRSFALAIVSFMQTAASRTHIKLEDWNRTVCIDTTGVGVTEFDLPKNKIDQLLKSGSSGVDIFMKWYQESKAFSEKPRKVL